jgi:hypothetical protein
LAAPEKVNGASGATADASAVGDHLEGSYPLGGTDTLLRDDQNIRDLLSEPASA